ncbi:transglutaminase-like domain-containing protein [Mariprofundus ferrooxydans]|uniref:Lipoprotein, putative n=1 Tax=Mariprofundus ferrooxydans PV-1 TaxID=314345 RepID=Q0F1Z1_9PROT|nr:transglutaminase family protein [Mariprofundus ferrooxydans]EAU55759.1 lipoprotein, putative [Mariprofundus ferrooxydans PV-1]KON47912.1 Cro/Cl family transcriptional regulator [Mariprofundus ferrooxydans]
MHRYLESSAVIDWQSELVLNQAARLASGHSHAVDIAKACYEFVRDEIKHSWDYRLSPVTCRASDVLKYGTGYCYAKSHLLAALLRANGIPCGLCYQRLTISGGVPPFSLHGLNAIWLEPFGWYRVDARGNSAEVDAAFCPPVERLAFPVVAEGEADFPEIWAEPLPMIQRLLENSATYMEVANHLPDIYLVQKPV